MKRYGVLSEDQVATGLNVYEIEQRYWRSLWHAPQAPPTAALK
jgi:hypothetical protein